MKNIDVIPDIQEMLRNVKCPHWAIVYWSSKTGTIHAYDAADPLRGHSALIKAKPELEYLGLIPCTSAVEAKKLGKTCAEYAKLWDKFSDNRC